MRKLTRNPLALLIFGVISSPIAGLLQAAEHDKLPSQGHSSAETNFLALLFLFIQIAGLVSLLTAIVLGIVWLIHRSRK